MTDGDSDVSNSRGEVGESSRGAGGTTIDATRAAPANSPAAFVLALVVMLSAVGAGEVVYRRSALAKAIPATDIYQSKVRDYALTGGADVVVVGSSRMFHGAVAPYLSQLATVSQGRPVSVYNFAVPADDLPGYVLTVEDVLRKGLKPPRLFVFGMSPIEWTCCPATSVPSSPKWVAAIRPRHAGALLLGASDPEEALTDLSACLLQSFGARTYVLNEVLRHQSPSGVVGVGAMGWVSFGSPVGAATQNARATGRAEAYRPNFYPPKHFDRAGTHRYFMRALDRLEAAGVKVAIIGTPQARQLDRNNDAAGYYPEYVAYMTELAQRRGTRFVNFNDFPGLTNLDFADGDHLVEAGARKFSTLLSKHVIEPSLRGEQPVPLP